MAGMIVLLVCQKRNEKNEDGNGDKEVAIAVITKVVVGELIIMMGPVGFGLVIVVGSTLEALRVSK